MRCSRARQLIALRVDDDLRVTDASALNSHIACCESCRRYADAVNLAAAFLRADAEDVRVEARPSPAFDRRLHLALLDERNARERSPSARLERALTGLIPHRQSAMVVVGRCVALAAALVAAFALSLAAVTAPPSVSSDIAVRHVTSITVRPADDGRVYAAVTQQSALGRSGLREVRLR